MHAALLSKFGGPDSFAFDEVADPSPLGGRTLVRLKAAALNWHDVLVRQGRYGSPLPHVPGADGAGLDVATGDEVVILPSLWWGESQSAPSTAWQILGDRSQGTYAELISVPSEIVFPRPAGFSWVEAAALPLVGVTTFRALVSRAQLRAGESLLITGAGGGVAPMAVSVALALGAHPFVTSSSDEKIARAVDGGALAGVSYRLDSWPEDARAISPEGLGFDVVLDTVGSWPESIRALKPGGRLVVLGASHAEIAPIDVRPFYFGQYSILGTTMGSPADFRGLLGLMTAGAAAPPPIDREFALADVAAAHTYLEDGAAFGKVVLTID
ncbi:MAG TPA: zinc-binding dehydrogenase [Galbitalea sp.]|jgi:NADPH:quinone reductase-like Zn-dependent oxidoreductase|nr:zinc-binding dehydrogenase [Galbitalea sp.]